MTHENNRKEEWDGRGRPGASYGHGAGKERGGFMAPKHPPRENKGNNGNGGRRINAIDDPEARARAYYGGGWADDGETEKGERVEDSDDEARYDFEEKGDGGEQKGGGMAGKARQ